MAQQGPPTPSDEPLLELDKRDQPVPGWRINPRWQTHLTGLRDRGDASPFRYTAVALTGQNDAIVTTAIPVGSLSAGLYRVAAVTRITTADGVSSSVTVTIAWTRNGVALSQALTANTGDATTSVVPDEVPLIHIDNGTPVSYATAYASNTANKMQYELDVVLERVAA